MEAGLLALFCRWHGRRFVFRTASDPDCDRTRVHLLVRYARDRRLYEYGLRRADAILVQSAAQAARLAATFGLSGRVAGMLVDAPLPACGRDIDVLWVSNIRAEKRPDRFLALARRLPHASMHMVGGPLPGADAMFREIGSAAAATSNVMFHGPLSYCATNDLYGRARLLVNTSDIEGFPNSYLQAWVRGVPVVTLIDPDGVIAREGLGVAVASPEEFPAAIGELLGDSGKWRAASERCRAFMAREYGEDQVLSVYLETFESVMRAGTGRSEMIMSGDAPRA
jgi:glycosyltransferase involved in cell wall biosynthesis